MLCPLIAKDQVLVLLLVLVQVIKSSIW
uniref:Uncharacterized protein n=1 Tax=Arundo donax TaxID=35708 RepID=A0A0A9EBY2_ARUDO